MSLSTKGTSFQYKGSTMRKTSEILEESIGYPKMRIQTNLFKLFPEHYQLYEVSLGYEVVLNFRGYVEIILWGSSCVSNGTNYNRPVSI